MVKVTVETYNKAIPNLINFSSQMTDPDNTPTETLIRAAEIGYEAGLRFVYAGNLPGLVKNYENTYCPNCHKLLVERYGYKILDYRITPEGKCPNCSSAIPGIWW